MSTAVYQPWHVEAVLASLERLSYSPHRPTPKQAAFLSLQCREAFYGGAAGGGKSDALLMAALQYVDVPGYAALLLRRTYADLSLPGALMDRSKEWLLGRAGITWADKDKTFRFPSGATLTLGYLDTEKDKYRYQGSEIQYCGFDELTQFSESQYRYLFSRLRRLATSEIPVRMRAASNPGGEGHDWVRRRFLDEGAQSGRVYIPAKLADNPHIDEAEYGRSLAELDPITRAQLLAGDWSARQSGGMFRREWFGAPVDAAPVECRKVRYWDLASSEVKPGKASDPDWTVGALMGRDARGILYLIDLRRVRATPAAVEALVRQTAELDGRTVPIWMEQEPGSSGVNTIDYYRRMVLQGWAFYGDKVTGPKEERARPLSSQAEAGNVKLVRGPWIGAFLDEADSFPMGSHDDQCLVAGTIIETSIGKRPIEEIRVGDAVLTRQGYRSVLACGMTNPSAKVFTASLSNGQSLTGTAKHPVFVQGKGFVTLDALTGNDILWGCENIIPARQPTLCSSRVSLFTDTPIPANPHTEITTVRMPRTSVMVLGISIRRFGRMLMAPFRRAMSFITRTGTRSTMTLATWNASRKPNTGAFMLNGETILQRPSLPIWTESARSPSSGTLPKRVGNGIGSMLTRLQPNESPNRWSASNAERYTKRFSRVPIGSALICARIGTGTNPDGGGSRKVARSVAEPFSASRGKSIARVSVLDVREQPELRPVFNMTVDGAAEYFANGVLVHNCDAVAGAYSKLSVPRAGAPVAGGTRPLSDFTPR